MKQIWIWIFSILSYICVNFVQCTGQQLKSSHRMHLENFSVKENQIAAIFRGVAYAKNRGTSTHQNNPIATDITETNEAKVPDNLGLIVDSYSEDNTPEAFYMIDNALSKSLIQEIPEISEEFSIPQLHISVPDHVPNEFVKEPNSLIETLTRNPSTQTPNQAKTTPTILLSRQNVSSQYNDLRSTRIKHTYMWIYHDYLAIIAFVFVLAAVLYVVVKVVRRKQHITPNYCLWLMLNLISICVVRVILYSVDPFGDMGRVGVTHVILLHSCVQWVLVYCIGIFTIMMVFPVYRPKSQVLPAVLLTVISCMFIAKVAYAIICSYFSIANLFYAYKSEVAIAAVNFAEISALMAALIILMLCTRQKHKIWWVRMYKKCLNSGNGNICVLYSHLRRGLRFGSCAALLQFLSTLLIISNDFDLHRVNFPLTPATWNKWIEETIKRTAEVLICILVTLGANQFFVQEDRRTIRARSSFRQFGDLLMGRRTGSKRSESNKISLGIFTINKTSRPIDSATTDFQLVWNNEQGEATSSFIDDSTWNTSRKTSRKYQSSDVIDQDNPASSNIYDNVTESTPIYQNQYFRYLEKPQNYPEPRSVPRSKSSLMGALGMVNMQKKKKSDIRPKSLVLTDCSKFHDPYSTSYISAGCINNYPMLDSKGNFLTTPRTEKTNPIYGTTTLSETRRKSSVVSSKYNTLDNSERLHTSKSVDIF